MKTCYKTLALAILAIVVMAFPCIAQEQQPNAQENVQGQVQSSQQEVKIEATEQPREKPVIAIQDAVICRDVVDHEPVGAGDVFHSDLKKLICFTRVVGAKTDTKIFHNWYFKDKMVSSVALRVASINWRTYSSKTILPEYAGEWKVEILSQDGELLKKIYFVIQ